MVAPLLFLTGKGGTGKTTIAVSLSQALADRGERVLLVEPYGQTGLQAHFDDEGLAREPIQITDNLSALRLEPRVLLEEYFSDLLKLPALARRLLSSSTFNAVTSAAPGVSEFLALDRLDGLSRTRRYDRIVIDGPATGHALQLLRAPSQLARIAAGSPLDRPLRRLKSALRRHDRASVALVSICEEMSVAESVEAQQVIGDELGIALERPILNRCAERLFTRSDVEEIDRLDQRHPLVRSARLQISAQQRANDFASALKKRFGAAPVSLQDLGMNPDRGGIGTALLHGWKL